MSLCFLSLLFFFFSQSHPKITAFCQALIMSSAYYISFNEAHLLVEEIAKPGRLALVERSAVLSRKQTNISLQQPKTTDAKGSRHSNNNNNGRSHNGKEKKNFFNILRIRCFLSKFPLKDTYSGGHGARLQRVRKRESGSGMGNKR